MAADQVPTQARNAEPGFTRLVRAVTQPGGKDINWQWVRAAGVVIGAIAVAHGAKTRTWRSIHSVATVLAVGGATAAYLKNKFVDAAGAPESK
jgi:hypothetical protein